MRVAVTFGADGESPETSADPIALVIDGRWTAIARRMPGRLRAWLVLQRFGGPEHVTTAFWSEHGWRLAAGRPGSPPTELDALPIPKSAKALARRALRRLPSGVV